MWGIVILFLAPLIFLYAGIPLLLAGLVWGGLFLVISSAKNPKKLLKILIVLVLLVAVVVNFIVVYGHKFLR